MRSENRSLKILYVEDNEDIRRVFDVLVRLTAGVEAEILLASDGQEGLELALRERPDIVFMDEELPLMDGLEATRRLRAQRSLCDVPVVMVSAHLDQDDRRRRAEEAGVTLLMDKPFDASDLENAMRCVLGG